MSILFGPASFKLVRGTTWTDDVVMTDEATGAAVNLSGIVGVTMRIRTSIGAATVLMELSVTGSTLVVVDAAAGKLGIRVGSAVTNTFPANNQRKAKYVYDAMIERTSGEYEAAVGGKITVLPSVTRALDP